MIQLRQNSGCTFNTCTRNYIDPQATAFLLNIIGDGVDHYFNSPDLGEGTDYLTFEINTDLPTGGTFILDVYEQITPFIPTTSQELFDNVINKIYSDSLIIY